MDRNLLRPLTAPPSKPEPCTEESHDGPGDSEDYTKGVKCSGLRVVISHPHSQHPDTEEDDRHDHRRPDIGPFVELFAEYLRWPLIHTPVTSAP